MELEELYKLFLASSKVSTDSRVIEKGCIYFALKGEHFDGNKFALDSLSKGASFAIVDDASLSNAGKCIYVQNVLATLQQLANHHRKQFKGKVIGITGSNGKTTTKELIYSILSKQAKTLVTKGNLNNHIGVPLTLLDLKLDEEYAIIEMGANHQGEIAFLSSISNPEIGIITNVGKAHLEGFGGFEGVKKGKAELYHHINKFKGTVLINRDEKELPTMQPSGLNAKYYGSRNNNEHIDYLIHALELEPKILYKFYDINGVSYKGESSLIGKHNFQNIKTAIALGLFLNISPDLIIEGIASYISQNNRSQFINTESNRVYLDAYNANPDSVLNSIKAFDNITQNPKIFILGDMLELGVYSLVEHQKIYDFVLEKQPEQIYLVGEEFKRIKAPDEIKFSNTEELKDYLLKKTLKNKLIFIKASRGIRLETLMDVI